MTISLKNNINEIDLCMLIWNYLQGLSLSHRVVVRINHKDLEQCLAPKHSHTAYYYTVK